MTKYKYITIKQTEKELFNKHPVYRIFNNKSNDQIGILSYYIPWRQYVFNSHDDCVFNKTCLLDIISFIDNHIK